MISGVGTDIVNIARIENRISNSAFLKLVFTPGEIDYCEQSSRSQEHFAARFAAKEAFFKALGTGISGDLDFTQAEVVNNANGKPSFIITGEALKRITELEIKNIHLSLSHEKDYATAFVILES